MCRVDVLSCSWWSCSRHRRTRTACCRATSGSALSCPPSRHSPVVLYVSHLPEDILFIFSFTCDTCWIELPGQYMCGCKMCTWLLQEKIELPVRRTKAPARPQKERFIRDDNSASSSADSESGELQMAFSPPHLA